MAAFEANAAIAQHARVKLSSGKLVVAVAVDPGMGTLEAESFAAGDIRTVRLRTAAGTQKFIAAGAIAQYAVIYAAAAGKVNDVVNGAMVGLALEAAAADGDIIEGIYMPNGMVAATHIIAATDLASCITRIDAILAVLENAGLTLTS